MTSLYLHIPFCKTKCCYCSFNSFAAMNKLHEPYVWALKEELCLTAAKEKIENLATLFIGGGTPTVLTTDQLVNLVNHVELLFGFADDMEISLEANPGTVTEIDLLKLKNGGVNRLSFGVQSFNDQELLLLGRCHNRYEAEEAFSIARKVGFDNINLDLMYGLPGQTTDSWQQSLETALSLQPDHLSLYQLTVEPGTSLEEYLSAGKFSLPGEDEVVEMDSLTEQLSQASGLMQYEISNYAKKGVKCRHNVNYWLNNEYLAAGSGAVSYLHGLREKRALNPVQYIDLIDRGESVILESEKLSTEAAFRETVIMGLRMNQGVSLTELYDRYSIDLKEYYGDTITRLTTLSLLRFTGDRLQITHKGRPLSNGIMAELV